MKHGHVRLFCPEPGHPLWLQPSDRLKVWLAVLQHAGEQGAVLMSVRELGVLTNCSAKQIRLALRWLTEEGMISVTSNFHKTRITVLDKSILEGQAEGTKKAFAMSAVQGTGASRGQAEGQAEGNENPNGMIEIQGTGASRGQAKFKPVNGLPYAAEVCTSVSLESSSSPDSGVQILHTPPISPSRLLSTDIEPSPKPVSAKLPGEAERLRWFADFWSTAVWAKIGVGAARRSWLAKVRTPEMRDHVIAAAREQAPGILRQAAARGGGPIHPATWLNQERYDDQEPATLWSTPKYTPPPIPRDDDV